MVVLPSKSFFVPFCLALVVSKLAHAQTPSFQQLASEAQANVDGNPAKAAELFDRALKLQPGWGDGWLYLGGSLYRLGKSADALAAFDKGIPLTPPRGASWAFRGLCEFDLKHYSAALDNFHKGETLGLGGNRPFEIVVRQHAAMAYIKAAQFDDAMRQLEPLSQMGEDSAGTVQLAGLCALTLNEWPQEISVQKQPVVNLAGKALWAATGRHAPEAVAAYHELLSTYPNESGVHYAHGIYLLESDQDAALQEFQAELRNNPLHWPSLLAAAGLQNKRGEPELALESARLALKTAPDGYLWLCHSEEGRALMALHQDDKAIVELEAAVHNAPSNPQMHFNLERAYRLAGRNEAARRERAEFVRLKAQQDPGSLAQGVVN